MVREKLRLLAAALTLGAAATPALGWETVTVVVQESSGEVREIAGTGIAYGYYTREFTPKGVKDRLRVEKDLPFSDRDLKFPEVSSIEFRLEMDGTTNLMVPITMHIRYQPKRNKIVEIDRKVAELRGFGNPNPVIFILTTEDGKVEFDITPPFDDEGRDRYRPILKVLFE